MSQNFELASKLARTLQLPLTTAYGSDPDKPAAALKVGTSLWVFPVTCSADSASMCADLSPLVHSPPPEDVTQCKYVIPGYAEKPTRLQFGHEAVSAKFAVNRLIDMPTTFEESQAQLLKEALSPVEGSNLIKIKATFDEFGSPASEEEVDAATLLNDIVLGQFTRLKTNRLVFIEAEAGKGKTILLASVVKRLQGAAIKLPIYIPLRKLPIQSGIGLRDVFQLVGVMGAGADQLQRAIQEGLVTLFLDGIDEVSGRYDRGLIRDLLSDLTQKLSGPETTLVLSGRKTEARQLEGTKWQIIELDLPDSDDPEFRRYVEMIFDNLAKEWNDYIGKFPAEFDELIGASPIDAQALSEKKHIVDWIVDTFPAVGKDQSLFFVQGLAAIGIGRRIRNRKPLVSGRRRHVPEVVDVCRAATVFACLREQSKIDEIARNVYVASNQMATLRGFAILASTTKSTPGLPSPNELAKKVFGIDPVNDHEMYTAIVRQNGKHALLYANEGAAGNYRPKFLSEWIRNAFLAEAVAENHECGINPAEIPNLIATADRARLAFASLIPDILLDNAIPRRFVEVLVKAAGEEKSAVACSNLWQLRAALGDDRVGGVFPRPVPLTQIDGAEFIGRTIDGQLTGESFFLDDTVFSGSSISNCTMTDVSLSSTEFRSCNLKNVAFRERCEGPILFEACTFRDCTFHNMRSRGTPALYFLDCRFECNCLISQQVPAYGETQSAPVAVFKNCTTSVELDDLATGDWLQFSLPLNGVTYVPEPRPDYAVECLREVLRTFFPTRMGALGDLQARDYIRLSALGRGCLPPGSPGRDELQSILESEGFDSGGRHDHLYAPWSSVMGGREQQRSIREDMIKFMQDSSVRGKVIQELLRKLSKYFP